MISDLLTIRADRDNYYYGCRLLTINFGLRFGKSKWTAWGLLWFDGCFKDSVGA